MFQAKVATDSDKTYEFCVYDCDIATGYGVDAILFLLLGQVILTVDTKCFRWGHCLDPGAFHLILSWWTFVSGGILAGRVGPQRTPHPLPDHVLRRQPAVRDASQERLRRLRPLLRLTLPVLLRVLRRADARLRCVTLLSD
ncbi:hypothetical protein OPV22_027440 [Ensete ventricosum]|uniref:Uncharacterized protein n=1 Tax=Ensete ventricosum TaxID=4639 RepID=A0AAV8PVC3_ENSVE|nr:hypothetical protein OPV22_027440 [Ensete ventricosum]